MAIGACVLPKQATAFLGHPSSIRSAGRIITTTLELESRIIIQKHEAKISHQRVESRPGRCGFRHVSCWGAADR